MNPNFKLDRPVPQKRWYHHFWPVFKTFGFCFKLLTWDVLGRKTNLRIELGSRFDRFIRGVLYRLLFAPVVLVLIACALVFFGTHPPVVSAVTAQIHRVDLGPVPGWSVLLFLVPFWGWFIVLTFWLARQHPPSEDFGFAFHCGQNQYPTS